MITAQQRAVNALACVATPDDTLAYCCGQTGMLKICSLGSGLQARMQPGLAMRFSCPS